MTGTFTRSATNTMTAARVRNVLLEVNADFIGLAVTGLIKFDQCADWNADLQYLLEHEAITSFQIQLRCPNGSSLALEYTVRADGSLRASDNAGGIDYHIFPNGTKANLFLTLNYSSRHINEVREYLRQHNWGFNGQAVTGSGSQDRVYSSDGYGVVRAKIGNWG
jgi:hypothetical protein